MKISSLICAAAFVSLASPLKQDAAQVEQSSLTPDLLAAVAVLENTTTSTTTLIDDTTTVVTSVLRTEEEVIEEEGDQEGSLVTALGDTAEPQPDVDEGATYLVNETTTVVTTVKASHTVTTTVLTTLTATQAGAPDEATVPEPNEDDDGVNELLDTPAVSTAPSAK